MGIPNFPTSEIDAITVERISDEPIDLDSLPIFVKRQGWITFQFS